MWSVVHVRLFSPWRLALLGIAAAALFSVACSHGKAAAVKKVEPVVLAELALAPIDLDNAYVVDQGSYLDDDGNPAKQPSHQFLRQMRLKEPQPGPPDAATAILITVGDPGVDKATEFLDTADDDTVGPPNLVDFIQQRIPGSHDVHVELLPDFPTYGDDTVANRLSWEQTINGNDETMRAYGVYVRSGGLIAFLALRAPAQAGGVEPEGLYQQTEAAAKRQTEKLKRPVALISPSK